MENTILSLKNIYMLLMMEDFPIYSDSVIARNDRRGLTMHRFWLSHIAPEFRSLPCGKMIWRNDGKRNRYTSYICNRSGEIKNYSEIVLTLKPLLRSASALNLGLAGDIVFFLTADFKEYYHSVPSYCLRMFQMKEGDL